MCVMYNMKMLYCIHKPAFAFRRFRTDSCARNYSCVGCFLNFDVVMSSDGS